MDKIAIIIIIKTSKKSREIVCGWIQRAKSFVPPFAAKNVGLVFMPPRRGREKSRKTSSHLFFSDTSSKLAFALV